MQTIDALFRSRRDADLAVEHLVQGHGIDRTDVFIRSSTSENTVGTEIAGADLAAGKPDETARNDAALCGEVKLSVDVADGPVEEICGLLREAGAENIRAH